MTLLTTTITAITTVIEWVGFWTAVALPLAYVYVFYSGVPGSEAVVLAKLFGIHVLALLAGRGYNVGSGYDGPMSAPREENRSV